MTRLEDKHIPIEQIKVKARYRKDLGDLADLKQSISELKVINPLTVEPDYTLVCGARRLQALKELGWSSVPVRIVDNPTEAWLLEAELDENTCRLPMKPLEMLPLTNAIHERLKADHDPVAQARKAGLQAAANAAAKRNGDSIPPPDPVARGVPYGKRAAKAAGWSYETWRQAKEIVDRADAGEPEAKEAVEEMERTGRVKPAWRKLNAVAAAPRPPIKVDTERRRARANSRKDRVAKAIYGLQGMCAGFAATDLRYVLAVTEPEELDEWDRILRDAVTTLRQLKSDLKNEGSVA